jgi:signal transduction histidine kinase
MSWASGKDRINELLDATRVEAGQLRLDLAPVNLGAVFDQALRAVKPRFDMARVRLRVERQVAPALVRGDAARLANVLTTS